VDKNRLWVVASVLAMSAILALGFILGIQPQLAAAAAANTERASVEATNSAQAAVLGQLKKDFAGIDKVRAELAPLNLSVPAGTEMPAFVNQLSELAGQSQVKLTGITVSEAQAYAPVVAPVAAVPAAAAPAADANATAQPTPTPTVVATAGVPPVVDARITSTNFASMGVQVQVKGDYGRVLDFVSGLQAGSRLFLVSGVSTVAATGSPDGAKPISGGTVDATITGLVYVLVPPAAAAVAAP
jgi:Tfp pilus assembly protein PilO